MACCEYRWDWKTPLIYATTSTRRSRLQDNAMEHHATIAWRRTSDSFTYDAYNRAHEWRINQQTIPASAAPNFRGDADRVNPEEAFVAALSSCHMLTLLALAAKRKFVLDSY